MEEAGVAAQDAHDRKLQKSLAREALYGCLNIAGRCADSSASTYRFSDCYIPNSPTVSLNTLANRGREVAGRDKKGRKEK